MIIHHITLITLMKRGQIKINDHLSPAEAETWAELGKNIKISRPTYQKFKGLSAKT